MRRFLTLTLIVILFAVVLAGIRLFGQWQHFLQAPIAEHSESVVWLAPGSSFRTLVRQLEVLGLARFDWRWRLYARLEKPVLQAGEYQIEAGMTAVDLVDRISRGSVRKHRLTIVEGWTFQRLRRVLADDPRVRPTIADLDPAELMRRLGCADCSPEGRFLPETYFFARGVSDFDLLERAHTAMQRTLDEIWAGRESDLPLDNPNELLVLASLIERETGQSGERARIAGVFVRRLETGMRLQTDPTVMYGLGDDFDGRLRRVHLTTDHPWNTYTRHGLPPTPIALPGRAALEAAAHPTEGTALYFVSRGDGSHYFSDTLAEHNAAVDRYIRGRQ